MGNRLTGRTALVTGGAKGIGLGAVRRFLEEGARATIADVDEEAGRQMATELGEAAQFRRLDVTDEGAWETLFGDLESGGWIPDLVVNNAGIPGIGGPGGPEGSLENFQAVMRVNLDGVFLGCKYGIKAMKERGGTIINVSSIAGDKAMPMAVAYGASKAAVRNYTRSVALYCTNQGLDIRCNAVMPGAVRTPLWDKAFAMFPSKEAADEMFTKDVPQKRWGTPAEVGDLMVFLASEESRFITGQDFVIDGGQLAKGG